MVKREKLSTNYEETQKEVLKLNVSQDDKVTKVSWALPFIIPPLEVYTAYRHIKRKIKSFW